MERPTRSQRLKITNSKTYMPISPKLGPENPRKPMATASDNGFNHLGFVFGVIFCFVAWDSSASYANPNHGNLRGPTPSNARMFLSRVYRNCFYTKYCPSYQGVTYAPYIFIYFVYICKAYKESEFPLYPKDSSSLTEPKDDGFF